MRLRHVRLSGLGKYLPPRVVTSAELEVRMKLPAGWIASHTGVEERRYADELQSEMAAKAVREALEDAKLKLSDISLLISAAGVPEQSIPCTAALIQKRLGPEATGIACFDVNTTCLSFVAALDVAAALVDGGSHRHVIVVSSEKASVGLNYDEPESASLMGDGAAAVIVSREEGAEARMAPAALTTLSAGAELAEVKSGGTAFHPLAPHTTRQMQFFHMEGPKIFRFAQKKGVPFFNGYLASLPWGLDEIRAVIPHQASLFAMRSMARAIGFEDGRMFENIQTHGNCVAASIPLALYDAVKAGKVRRGEVALLGGTAAGVSIGALAFRF